MSESSRRTRCAIYTRKSSDEGLEQSFNSLDAQREACAAYVVSQIGEGWRLLPTQYDDGGYSGGSMQRPALQRLLADIDAGKLDIVVVYKVDRLTRSLADFARIVERLDASGASFVSVTQAFNTTSSMGRLTLNVLLSFAQFEREVTGERIRDKIAASKARGMWMGGLPPLGYDAKDRTLVVNEGEAARVRLIFERAVQLGSLGDLERELNSRKIHSKIRTTEAEEQSGGVPFRRGALRHLLSNRLYLGEIVHKDKIYPGLHAAIVARPLFEAVQQAIATRAVVREARPLRRNGAPLTGLTFDAEGERLTPTFGRSKHGRLYRYYISAAAVVGKADSATIVRAPAEALEHLVATRMAVLTGDGGAPANADAGWAGYRPHLARVVVAPDYVRIELRRDTLSAPEMLLRRAERLPWGDAFELDEQVAHVTAPAHLANRGGAVRFLDGEGRAALTPSLNAALIRGIVRALDWRDALHANADGLAASIAREEERDVRFIRRGTRAAYLAPDIIRAVLAGRQPASLTMARLMATDLPLDWAEQRARFNRLDL